MKNTRINFTSVFIIVKNYILFDNMPLVVVLNVIVSVQQLLYA